MGKPGMAGQTNAHRSVTADAAAWACKTGDTPEVNHA